MKKIKIILKYNIYLILFICVLYSLIFIKSYKHYSKYNGNESKISGYVIEKNVSEKKTTLTIKGKEKVIVYYNKKININYNDFVVIYGKISKPSVNTNFNMFNYRNYLKNKKIYYIFNTYRIDVKRKNKNIFFMLKNVISNRIDKYKSKEYLKIFILANKSELDSDIKDVYKNLGVIHLLSISGSYISIMIIFLNKILNRYSHKDIIISIILIIYIILTSFQISIVRSSICYILMVINKKYKIGYKTLDIIVLFASFLLLINPFFLYDIGFLLSFIVSYSLIYFNNVYKDKNIIIKSILISTISLLSSLPILINMNYSVNFLSIILNIIYVPLCSLVLFSLSFFTYLFSFLDNIYDYMIKVFENISVFLNNINFFTYSFSKIPIVLVILYYYLLFIKKNKIYILCLLFIFYFYNYYIFIPRIYFVDVGQGDSTLIRYKNKNILIDTGGNYYDNSKEYIMFFKSVGVKKIDTIFLSHGDMDHAMYAYKYIKIFNISNIYINDYAITDYERKACYKKCKRIKEGDNIKISDLNFSIFNPSYDFNNENDNSLIIETIINNKNILFMGDASSDVEDRLIDEYYLDNIDVLKVGHHGSRTSSSKEFIDKIKPKYSVISVGKYNKYGHPSKETIKNLKKSKIYRTDINGSIMFKIQNKRIRVKTCLLKKEEDI